MPPFHKILYRVLVLIAMFAAMASIAALSPAQESTPEIVPLKREHRTKKDLGPRALGLLRITPSGKATLIPVMIEINGKFYDASAYKADPVPMALESGIVYEGEKTGAALGLFTINSALHSLAANAEVPWLATGAWLAAGSEAPKSGMKAEVVPKGIETTDAPPRLTKSETTSSAAAPSTTSTTPAPPGSSPSATPPAPASTSPPASSPGTPKPEGKKDDKTTDQKKSTQNETPPASAPTSQSSDDVKDDTNRPRLRRGKPTGPMPDYDVPGYGKPESGKDSGARANDNSATKPAANSAPMEAVELVPAISDADGPELHSFVYEWDKGVEDDRRKQMLDLAKAQLLAYIDARAKGQIPAKRAAPHSTARKSASKTPEPIFENVQMRTFDLWGSNQPVLVLSADAHLPPPAAGGTVDLPSAPLQYKIMLVTRTDIYGNLHRLYSGVTDRFHLDVTPQLDLIDAVDADGDGRGELLFHKTTDAGNGYTIYKATADTLWKMFDTVNPE
ncbi:MAG: hypothetical protein ABR921_03530 [Candidatus Sulfotelmatobacter sp.]